MSEYGTDFVKALKPAKYTYKKEMEDKIPNYDKTHFGIMAQSINDYLKSVSNEDFNIISEDDDGIMMVNYLELIGPLVKTIQELEARIKHLEIMI